MERDTKQRRAIRRIFEAADRPLSPHEVLELARAEASSVGIATIYRNLKALSETGWLVPVGLPGEPDRYELAGKHHHHHFHCRVCDKVYDLEGCPGSLAVLAPRGFRVDHHEIYLYGTCANCGKGMKPPARKDAAGRSGSTH